MNPAGHLASAWLMARPRPLERIVPAYAGMLLPDVIDKSLMLLRETPFGRTVGHSALFWAAMLSLGLLVGAGPRSTAFLAGGLLHLCINLADDVVDGFECTGYAFSAWLGWPITNPDMYSWIVPHAMPRQPQHTTSLELATVAFTMLATLLRAGKRSSTA